MKENNHQHELSDQNQKHNHNHMISLYYCYPPKGLPATHLKSHADFHERICHELKLGGRIRVSEEGINGVLSGLEDELREYEGRLRRELLVVSGSNNDGRDGRDGRGKEGVPVLVEEDEDLATDAVEQTNDWLDIKYCHLRNDVPIEKQLFDSLSVKATKEVVSLFDSNWPSNTGNKEGAGNGGKNKGRRCRQRRKQKRRLKKQEEGHCQEVNDEDQKENRGEDSNETGEADEMSDEKAEEKKQCLDGQTKNRFEGENRESVENRINNITKSTVEPPTTNPTDVGSAFVIQDWDQYSPAVHLSPQEWNNRLLELSRQQQDHNKSIQKENEEKKEIIESRECNQQPLPSNDGKESEMVKKALEEGAILLDARNIYETRVGHFAVPNLPTFFPNTRKFSSLPMALNTPEAAEALAGKQVFMYCTGGVRCERAGTYLRALSESNTGAWKDKEQPKGIYQLRGGIQKYLEAYGEPLKGEKEQTEGLSIPMQHASDGEAGVRVSETLSEKSKFNAIASTDDKNGEQSKPTMCLYRGKNFVFDPRRTDPVVGSGVTNANLSPQHDFQSKYDGDSVHKTISLVGQCIVCSTPHDDYDNGHAPSEGKEARCCRCRVLVLVCNNCRQKVRCWGEPEESKSNVEEECKRNDLFCGHSGRKCVDEGNVAENVETTRF